MTIGARYGRLNLFACALFVSALMFAAEALAAPRAAELGPELPLAEPAGGFVGKLSVTPQGGPAEYPAARQTSARASSSANCFFPTPSGPANSIEFGSRPKDKSR